ncbi:hypothetical protein SXIM_00610 [Streptomyces xiamenensis]|uniref:Uncharacterized protein n=1 Tax=Streptomyces xiamenensis TaxID=408015 RepID=A0A0F7FNF8_9ACTN|nr:hypothetical protein SXIM_00610 [Streptomyces xiamenensis]
MLLTEQRAWGVSPGPRAAAELSEWRGRGGVPAATPPDL